MTSFKNGNNNLSCGEEKEAIIYLAELKSHTRMEQSRDEDTSHRESGLNAISVIASWWPVKVRVIRLISTSIISML